MTHHTEQVRGTLTGGLLAFIINLWDMLLGSVTFGDVFRTVLFSFIGAAVGYFTTKLLQRLHK